MRIALLSTGAVPVPPPAYGGTELVVAELARNFVRLGHEVVTYATGDSAPEGALRHRFERSCWPPEAHAELAHCAWAARDIQQHRPGFDVIHPHVPVAAAVLDGRLGSPVVLSIHHDRHDAMTALYGEFPQIHYVTISHRQAELVPEVPVRAVVHHGLNPARYEAGDGAGDYGVYLGRLAAEKGPHLAIEASRAAGVPLRIAGKPHPPDLAYFESRVRPMLAPERGVQWVGEVGHDAKVALLRQARALLFPIQWEEPFGLVLIEAMLVGTPVIALRAGSTPEIVDHGVTGLLVDSVGEMAEALSHICTIDRARCRRRAQERWDGLRMTQDYLRVYERAMQRSAVLELPRAAGVRRSW